MKQNWRIVLCLLVVIGLMALMGVQGQLAATEQTAEQTAQEEPDISQFPTVEYSARKVKTEKQKERSKKYNSGSPAITEGTEARIFLISDWDLRLPALPVDRSAAVIIGEVTDRQALLSDDESQIYSEFVVQIQQILKNGEKCPLGAGNLVVLERFGGRVRFPSGKLAFAAVNQQDHPKVGKRYLFFLMHEGPDARQYEDFIILTGYELRNGRVYPLDKLEPGHPITAYKGTSEASLLKDLANLTNTVSHSN